MPGERQREQRKSGAAGGWWDALAGIGGGSTATNPFITDPFFREVFRGGQGGGFPIGGSSPAAPSTMPTATSWSGLGAAGGKGMTLTQILKLAEAAGSIFGGAAKARGASKLATSGVQQQQNRDQIERFKAQLQAALEARNAPTQAAGFEQAGLRSGVLNDVLKNVQDVKFTHPRAHIPEMTGGLRPSLLKDSRGLASQDVAQQLKKAALMRLMNPSEGMPSAPELATPDATKKPGFLDKLLGIGGFAGNLLGGLQGSGLFESVLNPSGRRTETSGPWTEWHGTFPAPNSRLRPFSPAGIR